MALNRVEVYRSLGSDGAWALVQALRNLGVETVRRRRGGYVKPGTLVVCWGQSGEALEGGKVLNGARLGSKLKELKKLRVALPDNSIEYVENILPNEPFRVEGEWLGRRLYHQSANDLRQSARGAREPDFYVRKLNIASEYRCHVFNDRVIRTGKKMPDPDNPNRHPWIRSLETGWIINYGTSWRGADEDRMPTLRKVARTAVEACGYDFGAVDLGVENGTGRIVAFEVNQAPALVNANTAKAYAEAIKKVLV